MGLGKRIKKKYTKYKNKVVGALSKVDPLVGMYQAKKDADDYEAPSSSSAQQYALKDVARSRAAGSGVFNYTDQEMKPK